MPFQITEFVFIISARAMRMQREGVSNDAVANVLEIAFKMTVAEASTSGR